MKNSSFSRRSSKTSKQLFVTVNRNGISLFQSQATAITAAESMANECRTLVYEWDKETGRKMAVIHDTGRERSGRVIYRG